MAFIGEIQLFSFGYAPPSWLLCNGSSLPITRFPALFSLIGNSYGGNGRDTFQVPNLIGRAACGQGQGPVTSKRQIGDTFGAVTATLSQASTPAHSHGLSVYVPTTSDDKHNVPLAADCLATPATSEIFVQSTNYVDMNVTLGQEGGIGSDIAAHENRQPFVGLTYYILVDGGDFPVFG